jgi:hypothetical protein
VTDRDLTELPDDPLVRAMLRKLPVPDHRPGFWDDLQVSLAGGAPGAVAVPTETVPTETVPTETVPTETVPTETVPTETVPAAGTGAPVPEPPVALRITDLPPDAAVQSDLAPVADRRRGRPRPSSVIMALTAAAAAVVVGVAATTLLRDAGTGDDVDTAASTEDAPDAEGEVAITAPPLPGEVTGTTAMAAHGTGTGTLEDVTDLAYVAAPTSAREAAASFVMAVHGGDADAAWGLLGPASQAFWESRGRFGSALSELAEGRYGAFGEARGLTVSSLVLVSSGSGEAGVVVLDGIVDLDGDERRRTLDLPYRYRADAGSWVLEPWGANGAWTSEEIGFRSPETVAGDAIGGASDDADPDAGWPTLAADGTVAVTVPQWVETATIAVDGIELAAVAPSARGVVAVTPSAPFAPGLHRLTVAGIGPDGIAAATVLFRVP